MNSYLENSMFIENLKNTSNKNTSEISTANIDQHSFNITLNTDTINNEKNIKDIWTKDNFNYTKINKHELNLNLKATKMSWTSRNNNGEEEEEMETEKPEEKSCTSPTPSTPDKETVTSPSHHARRPMNAFLIFCKKHRPIVRKKFPTLENRGVTRILGEWWALLDGRDKDSYTKLAKEYKDAFFSANPNFKWYKLPAPTLRTLPTRLPTIQKELSPLESPTETTPTEAQFTPGKLADESQLGMLTSLLNNNFASKTPENDKIDIYNCSEQKFNNNNNNNVSETSKLEFDTITPENISLPQKPLKKRLFEANDNKQEIHIADISKQEEDQTGIESKTDNMTKQDLYEKVVDSMFTDEHEKAEFESNNNFSVSHKNKLTETRKSGRSCKGKKYEEFMKNGNLLKNKRDKRLNEMNYHFEARLAYELKIKNDATKPENETPKLDLEKTIKRLAERTNVKLNPGCKRAKLETNKNTEPITNTVDNKSDNVNSQNSYFNLELRIAELPFLSYDEYVFRKKDSKKRKLRKVTVNLTKRKIDSNSPNKSLVGSKKRKNKNNITHLEKTDRVVAVHTLSTDLSGLATLAEIAAHKEKLNELK